MSEVAETMCAATVGARIIVMDGYGMSLDGRFQLVDDEGSRFWVNGWCCLIELDEDGKGEGKEAER